MFIVMKDDEFFIVDVIDDLDFTELKEIIDVIGKENLKLYFTIYRTMMGVPLNVTPRAERAILTERYGEALMDNEDFVSNIVLAQREFNSKKLSPPDVLLWLVERGAEIVPAKGVIQI